MEYVELLNRLAVVYPGCAMTDGGQKAFGRARLRRLAAIWKDAGASTGDIPTKLLTALPLSSDLQRTTLTTALTELWPA